MLVRSRHVILAFTGLYVTENTALFRRTVLSILGSETKLISNYLLTATKVLIDKPTKIRSTIICIPKMLTPTLIGIDASRDLG